MDSNGHHVRQEVTYKTMNISACTIIYRLSSPDHHSEHTLYEKLCFSLMDRLDKYYMKLGTFFYYVNDP